MADLPERLAVKVHVADLDVFQPLAKAMADWMNWVESRDAPLTEPELALVKAASAMVGAATISIDEEAGKDELRF